MGRKNTNKITLHLQNEGGEGLEQQQGLLTTLLYCIFKNPKEICQKW